MKPNDTNVRQPNGPVRTFGVEEELLLVDEVTLSPLAAGARAVSLGQQEMPSGHEVTAELKQEQLEVASPPQTTLAGQLDAVREGRSWADSVAARAGGRVVALPTAPGPVTPHLVPDPRYRRISERFGLVAYEQLTCGFHIHVQVNSQEEGVAVLDRIRVWLPVVLALSANSPFWHGTDTGYASYRYQVWNRWPMAGPTDIFGSAAAYDRYREVVLGTGVPLDAGMLYFDARLSDHQPTLEVRLADVCLEAEHAAVLAAMVRALVEATARDWAAGNPAPDVPASLLQLWTWQASFRGAEAELIDPATGTPAPARKVIADLLELLRPVLTEYGEQEAVKSTVADILESGSGARRQREAYSTRHDLSDVMSLALEVTHRDGPVRSDGALAGTS